jgi:hypothetical protein
MSENTRSRNEKLIYTLKLDFAQTHENTTRAVQIFLPNTEAKFLVPDFGIGLSYRAAGLHREEVFMEGPIEPNVGPSLADVLLCTFESTNAGFSSFPVRNLLS